jgi:beta-glucosidase
VAAWLPGTEGEGVADVLFARRSGACSYNFSGTLAMPWPGVPCPDASGSGIKAARWLFAPGYGLRYPSKHAIGTLSTDPAVDACAEASVLSVFHTLAVPPFSLYLADADPEHPAHDIGSDLNAVIEWPASHPVLRLRTVQVNTQQDAKSVTWLGTGRFFARSPQPRNLAPLVSTHAALQFDVVIATPAKGPVKVYMGCGDGCTRSVDLTHTFATYANGDRHTVSIPLECFIKGGADLSHVDVPFGVLASPPFSAAFADVKIVAGAPAGRADLTCASLGAP